MDPKELIARRAAKELSDGYVVNLGIGLPTMVANYLPEGKEVNFQSENGIMGLGPAPEAGNEDYTLTNAGGQPVTTVPGAMFFDSATSFGIIRGGHVDATILGALEVSQNGDIANWKVPGKLVPGMGGAMDLVSGAKRVIAAMIHTQKGDSKIKKNCTLPLTAAGKVTDIITDLAYFKVINGALVLMETAPGVSVDQVRENTEAEFSVSETIKEMEI
ncbi:MAG: CoA transferase subunit B [Candidatus Delongbacteria bacterium]|nr:CoA transferase subunit B [Candidatus Delongbacteria bacterium]MBN2833503.1 CoA transferase subunit B [Candidatus Delongbacteria bacterium]